MSRDGRRGECPGKGASVLGRVSLLGQVREGRVSRDR